MDPTDEVLASMTTVGHACILAGMTGALDMNDPDFPGDLVRAYLALTGCDIDTIVHLLAGNSSEDMSNMVRNLEVTNKSTGETKAATMMQKGMANLVDRYIRIKLGLMSRPSAPGPAVPTPVANPVIVEQLAQQRDMINSLTAALDKAATALAATATAQKPDAQASTVGEPKVSLKEVVSQATDASCKRMSASEMNAAYDHWRKTVGDSTGRRRRPPEDEDPTEEQLSSLKFLLDGGSVPYVDFAVWAPLAVAR